MVIFCLLIFHSCRFFHFIPTSRTTSLFLPACVRLLIYSLKIFIPVSRDRQSSKFEVPTYITSGVQEKCCSFQMGESLLWSPYFTMQARVAQYPSSHHALPLHRDAHIFIFRENQSSRKNRLRVVLSHRCVPILPWRWHVLTIMSRRFLVLAVSTQKIP